MTKAERVANSKRREATHKLDVNTAVDTAMNELAYEYKRRSSYYLLSMLTLWITIPKDKANMPEVGKYAWRMNNGKQKSKEKQDVPVKD